MYYGRTSWEQAGDSVRSLLDIACAIVGLVFVIFSWISVFRVQDEVYGGPPDWGFSPGRLVFAVLLTWVGYMGWKHWNEPIFKRGA